MKNDNDEENPQRKQQQPRHHTEEMFMKKQLPVKRKDEWLESAKNNPSIDKALLNKYLEKKGNPPARFKFDKKGNHPGAIIPDAIEISDIAFHNVKMFRAFGTTSFNLQQHFINQLAEVFRGTSSKAAPDSGSLVTICNMALTILDDIRPRDIIEGMLVTQMIGVHNMAMDTLGRAMLSDQTFAGKEANIHMATKMLRTFVQQMDSLKNYRQKGQQKVIVEHVNVNSGGQAIVGSVTKGGEG